MKKLLSVCMILVLMLSATGCRIETPPAPSPSPVATPVPTQLPAEVAVSVYTTDDAVTTLVLDKEVILPTAELGQALIGLLQESYGIEAKTITIDDNGNLVIDLAASMQLFFDQGSTGGQVYTKSLLKTLLSIDHVQTVQVLIDGKENPEGSHFNFEGIFDKSYMDTPDVF